MNPKFRKRLARGLAGALTALTVASTALAQESLEHRLERLEKQNEEIRKNAEVLQKQNEMLLKLLNTPAAATPVSVATQAPLAAEEVRGIVSTYLQEKEAKQKAEAAAAADAPYKVGTDLKMS